MKNTFRASSNFLTTLIASSFFSLASDPWCRHHEYTSAARSTSKIILDMGVMR